MELAWSWAMNAGPPNHNEAPYCRDDYKIGDAWLYERSSIRRKGVRLPYLFEGETIVASPVPVSI